MLERSLRSISGGSVVISRFATDRVPTVSRTPTIAYCSATQQFNNSNAKLTDQPDNSTSGGGYL